jgi:putative tryptophan/tyrosine transport system substrate-binding protein
VIIGRRDFIALVGGAVLTWPIAGRTQQSKVVRIGALYIGLADAESFRNALRDGLRELGYVEGQNVAFEFRSAEGRLDRLPGLAAELVRLKVDLIVALYVPSALAAKQATRDIPIVIIAADPVETGIVSSLARPDGNITGVSLMSAESTAKNIELFHDMLPSVKRVGVLVNAANPVYAEAMLDKVLLAGGTTGIDVRPIVRVREPDELERAFTTFVREGVGALVVQGDLATKPVANIAVKYRVPAASTTRAFVDVGGLMSFGADGPSSVRHGTRFVQRILQGRHPKDMPVEQPTTFELVVNLKAAKVIGLTIPDTFLLRADSVLE